MVFSGGTYTTPRVQISDYAGATGVLTMASGTYGSDTVYGIESVLPAECEDYWLALAAFMAASKPGSVVDDDAFRQMERDLRIAKDLCEEWIDSRIKDHQYTART